MVGSKWVRDFCYYQVFGVMPDPTGFDRPSKNEEPCLLPADAVTWRSTDLAECRNHAMGRALAMVMDQMASRVKAPRDRLGEDYWRTLARDAEHGPPDPIGAVRVELAGKRFLPQRAVAAALQSDFGIPPNGRTLTVADAQRIDEIGLYDRHRGKPYVAELQLIADALRAGDTVRLIYDRQEA